MSTGIELVNYRPTDQNTKHYGRFTITPEALATLLGLPEDTEVRIEFNFARACYNVLIASKDELIVNGTKITHEVPVGCEIPVSDYRLSKVNVLERIELVKEEITEKDLQKAIDEHPLNDL